MASSKILIGRDVASGKYVEARLQLFERHTWIQGMTGSWKTLLLTAILVQLMRLDPTAAFAICDFGGDKYPFNRLLELAKQLGKPFQFVSLNRDDDWDSLDPTDAVTPLEDLSMAAAYFHAILGGDHGEGYGRGYFGRYAYVSILRTLMSFLAEGVYTFTLHDFARRFAKTKGKLSEQSEAQLAAEMLLTYEQVQPSEWGHKRIDVPRAIERGQVTYALLPTLMHPGARMLANTFVFSFVLEAMRRSYAGLPLVPIYLVIDEFPAVAGSKQHADLVVLARKYGIRIIVLTQTSEQLNSNDRDLFPVLFDNTALKIWLTPTSSDDMDILQSLSKEVLKQRGATQGFRSGVSSVSMHEVYEPRLERNEIRDAAYTAGQGYFIANAFEGHVEPQRFQFAPDLPLAEYSRLSQTPLPKRVRPIHPAGHQAVSKEHEAHQAALNALFEVKRRQLVWEASK